MNMSEGTSVCLCGGMHVTLVESKYVYVEVGNEDVCLSVSLSAYLLACIYSYTWVYRDKSFASYVFICIMYVYTEHVGKWV